MQLEIWAIVRVQQIACSNNSFSAVSSEVLLVFFDVSAERAAQSTLLPVRLVVDLERALVLAWALRQLIRRVLRDVVAVALTLVTRLAEVSRAPAEPLRDGATVSALELDEILPMLLAVVDRNVAALGADQLFWLEIALVVLQAPHAVLQTSEVGRLALEALVVGVDGHGVLLRLVEEGGLGVDELRILQPLLELQPFHGH